MLVTKNPVPALKCPRGAKISPYGRHLLQSTAGNAALPHPFVSLADLEADLDALDAAEIAAPSGGKVAVNKRNELRFKVRKTLNHLRDYVESVVETQTSHAEALTIIASAGMQVRKVTKNAKAQLAAKNVLPTGNVELSAQAAKGSAVYYWEYSDDQATWIRLPDTLKASTLVTGLKPMMTYYFRFHTLTRKGESALSQVVSLLVM